MGTQYRGIQTADCEYVVPQEEGEPQGGKHKVCFCNCWRKALLSRVSVGLGETLMGHRFEMLIMEISEDQAEVSVLDKGGNRVVLEWINVQLKIILLVPQR